MTTFPPKLKFPSDPKKWMTLDRNRLLLAFKSKQTPEQIQTLLLEKNTGLILEDLFDCISRKMSRPKEKVNHGDERYWVRSLGNTAISIRSLKALNKSLGSKLAWIGPVYRLPNTKGRQGLLCPLPHQLVIKPVCQPQVSQLAVDNSDGFKPLSKQLARFGLKEMPNQVLVEHHRIYLLKNPQQKNIYALQRYLDAKANIEADFNYMPLLSSFAQGPTPPPNDPLLSSQWNLTHINAKSGWTICPGGNPAMVVALIDQGCDLNHPDLQGAFTSGMTFKDGKQIAGGGAINGDTDPLAHGTECAGIIAARADNKIGIAGLAYGCTIMPIALQEVSSQSVAAAIDYASRNGARVISISLSYPDPGATTPVDTSINVAFSKYNVVLCVAAGNTGGTRVSYPASNPCVIACGASDQTDRRSQQSDWESTHGAGLSVMAPGCQISTTVNHLSRGTGIHYPADYTQFFEGTSAATPHVAALAALILTVDPTLRPIDVRNIIEQTAQRTGGYAYADVPLQADGSPMNPNNGNWDTEMGYGLIDVNAALARASS